MAAERKKRHLPPDVVLLDERVPGMIEETESGELVSSWEETKHNGQFELPKRIEKGRRLLRLSL